MVASGAKTPFELCAFNAFVAEAQLKPVVLWKRYKCDYCEGGKKRD